MQFLRQPATIAAAMKLLLFLTLAFFSGIEGFGLFAAYLACGLSIHLVVSKLRNRPQESAAESLPADDELLLADVR